MDKQIKQGIKDASVIVSCKSEGSGLLAFTRRDKEAEDGASRSTGAALGSHKTSKYLLPDRNRVPSLQRLKSAHTQWDKFHRDYMTRQFRPGQGGGRILPIKYIKPVVVTFQLDSTGTGYKLNMPQIVFKRPKESLEEFAARIGEQPTTTYWLYQQTFSAWRNILNKCKREFLKEYPSLLEKVKQPEHLGKAYNEDEYPTVEELENGVNVKVEYDPPKDDDIELLQDLLGMDEVDMIMENALQAEQDRLRAGNAEVISCLTEPLTDFINKMRNREDEIEKLEKGEIDKLSPFKECYLENLKQAVLKARLKNISGDPTLEKLCLDIDGVLGVYDTASLKDSAVNREAAAEDAESLKTEVGKLTDKFKGIL